MSEVERMKAEMDAGRDAEQWMMGVEAEADAWAAMVGLTAMIKNVASVANLSPSAPAEVRAEFINRMEAQIDAVVQQGFIEGWLYGSMCQADQDKIKLAALKAERDAARRIVQNIHWMARRYADGRRSYAPEMFNDAVRPAFEAGWLKLNGAADESQYARDGNFSDEWKSLEGRLAQAEAERDAACLRISEQDQQIGRLEGRVEGLRRRADKATAEALEEAARFIERDDPGPYTRLDPARHKNLSDWFNERRAAGIRALSPTSEADTVRAGKGGDQ